MKIPFIDIHTHHPVNSEEIISVHSLFLQDVDLQNDINTPFSAAIHPWHATKFAPEQVSEMLNNLIKQPEFIAIGETGLDKLCNADYQHQKNLFELQLEFAVFYRKPVIIHAVRSWNELTWYLKQAKVPIILHGYSAGKELTKQLIDLGCYFSLGKSVLQITPSHREAIQIIPLNTLFLETDDSSANIMEIYFEVSKITGLQLDELKIQIHKNFKSLFF
ncbi:MAG: TatD family hydrolase [Bacteroidia bacterium]|nr:TatD family hydrolase [Bacteroidia bacterium]